MKASGISAILLSLVLVTLASAQDTFTVDITRTDAGGAIGANDCFEFEIRGHLTNDSGNEGLAFFAFDLEVVSDPPGSTINLGTAVLMSAPISGEVDNFSQPQGYSVDFTGTVVGDDLVQAGGGQNTIRNTGVDPFPPFPSGDVTLNVGHGVDGVVLFEAPSCPFGFSVPGDIVPGSTYTFQIKPGSLYANVITSFDAGLDTYVVDPVMAVIGTGVVIGGCDAPAPEIVHDDSKPCSGTIDAAIESSDGVALDMGLTQTEIHFNTEVFQAGGGDVDASNFVITETGGGTAPTVTGVSYGVDNTIVIVDWDRPLTLQEWTTVRADVYNACGDAIVNGGDLGPGVDESDRVDIAFLPGDVDRSSNVGPFDILAFRQIVNSVTPPSGFGCSADELDYIDINRSGVAGVADPFDLLALRQIVTGVSPTTRVWNDLTMNNDRP